jgi:hypothetical protein
VIVVVVPVIVVVVPVIVVEVPVIVVVVPVIVVVVPVIVVVVPVIVVVVPVIVVVVPVIVVVVVMVPGVVVVEQSNCRAYASKDGSVKSGGATENKKHTALSRSWVNIAQLTSSEHSAAQSTALVSVKRPIWSESVACFALATLLYPSSRSGEQIFGVPVVVEVPVAVVELTVELVQSLSLVYASNSALLVVPGDSANQRHIWLSLRYVKNKQLFFEHSSAHAATSMLLLVVPSVPLCRLSACLVYPSSPVGQ